MDQSELRPSSAYAITAHLHGEPAYYHSYFLADMNRLALVSTLKNRFGSSFSPHTASFLIKNIMIGNQHTIDERIASATGMHDQTKNTIEYFNATFEKLAR